MLSVVHVNLNYIGLHINWLALFLGVIRPHIIKGEANNLENSDFK